MLIIFMNVKLQNVISVENSFPFQMQECTRFILIGAFQMRHDFLHAI